MYESFYGLRGRPFRLSPDPDYFFASATHAKGLAYLRYGLLQGEGFVVVTGVPGTGKTTLINTLVQELPESKFLVAKLSNTLFSVDDLFRTIARLFGLKTTVNSKVELLDELENYLLQQVRQGKRALLLIDEAHNLTPHILEELRLLTNFQYRGKYILQIFLLGQAQLEEILGLPEMLQLRQRVLVSHRLEPIAKDEIRDYIVHRLEKAGWNGNPSFSNQAYWLIHYFSEGIPRQINTLSDRVLLYAYLEEKQHIDRGVIEHVVEELKLEPASYVHGREFTDLNDWLVSASDAQDDDDIKSGVEKNTGRYLPTVSPGYATNTNETRQSQNFVNVVSWRTNAARKINNDVAVAEIELPSCPALTITPDVEISSAKENLQLLEASDLKSSADAVSSELPETTNLISDARTDVRALENLKSGAAPVVTRSPLHSQYGNNSDSNDRVPAFLANMLLQWRHQKNFGMVTAGVSIGLMMLLSLYIWAPVSEIEPDSVISDFASLEVTAAPATIAVADTMEFVVPEVVVEKESEVVPVAEVNEVIPDLQSQDVSQSDLSSEKTVEAELSQQVVAIATIVEPLIGGAESVSGPTLEVSSPSIDEFKKVTSNRSDATTKTAVKSKVADKVHEPKTVKTAESTLPEKLNVQENETLQPITPVMLASTDVLPDSNSASLPRLPGDNVYVELIRHFKVSYQDGDLDRFVEIFSQDVTSNDTNGIKELRKEYKKLFNVTDLREIDLTGITWKQDKQPVSGKGMFELKVREKGGSKSVSYSGGIELEVDQSGARPLISKIFYSYDN